MSSIAAGTTLTTAQWDAPVAMPEDAGTGEPPKRYAWDEATTSWVESE